LCTPSAFLCGWNISFATIPFHISMCRLDASSSRNKVQSLKPFRRQRWPFQKPAIWLPVCVSIPVCRHPPAGFVLSHSLPVKNLGRSPRFFHRAHTGAVAISQSARAPAASPTRPPPFVFPGLAIDHQCPLQPFLPLSPSTHGLNMPSIMDQSHNKTRVLSVQVRKSLSFQL
jgi:hypothetical protein